MLEYIIKSTVMKIVIRRVSYAVVKGNLRLKLRWNGEVFVKSLGIKVDKLSASGKPKWDGRRCVNGTVHGKDRVPSSRINMRLAEIEDKIDRLFYKFEVQDLIPGLEDVKREMIAGYDEKRKKSGAESLESLFNRFILEQSELKGWAPNTIKSVRGVMTLVLQFSPNAKIAQIDADWLARFVNYQKHNRVMDSSRNRKTESPGYANNVIAKNCRIFKWFLKWAVDKKLLDRSMVAEFRPSLKTIRKPVIFLTWEELMTVWNLDLSGMDDLRLDEARDIFCFQCFTSLRYSDTQNLLKSQVTGDTVVITAQKTATPLEIELNKYSRALLEKYSSKSGDHALPRMALADLNRLLKKLGKRVGLDTQITISQFYGAQRRDITKPKYELLSSHAGRRTFICNALALGISPTIVMKWTGHSEYAAMKPYIDVADNIKKDSMKLFDAL